jgi:hypothetical protein
MSFCKLNTISLAYLSELAVDNLTYYRPYDSDDTTMARSSQAFGSPVTKLLPYTFLCTIGPSVTAATALFIVVRLCPSVIWLRQKANKYSGRSCADMNSSGTANHVQTPGTRCATALV